MKYEKLAKDIIENVGGIENVNSVVHCITRLRFKLKDDGKVNEKVLNDMEGVVTTRKAGGQYQVVIGNHVPEVYKAVVAVGGFTAEKPTDGEDEPEKKGNLFDRFIDMIAGIFTPILSVLVAAGMIKGFNALFVALGWLNQEGGTYQILNAIGDGLFYFLPILLGYTAMKKFGGTPFLGSVIAMALVYPALEAIPQSGEPLYTLFAGTVFESPIYIEFFGIPVILMTYSMSVIPIILAAFFAAKFEIWLNKVIPNVIKTFFVPMLVLLVIVPLTFIIVGPIATWLGQSLGSFTIWIYELSPIIAGMILGGLWLVFVMFGLHWGLVPIGINNMAVQGQDPILALMFAHSFALAAALFAVWLKTKNTKTKSLSMPAVISAIFGVTEPGMYGIALPLKRPFIITLISSAIGGGILGFFGTIGYTLAGLGVFQWPSFIHPEEGLNMAFYGSIIAVIVSMILAFVLTYLFGGINKDGEHGEKESENEPNEDRAEQPITKTAVTSGQTEIIESPLKGVVRNLADIEDSAFASGALGQGVAIEPTEGKLVSPVSGTVTALYPTNHAVGVTSDDGAEILIHIGMDTVQLDGKYFTGRIRQGDRVEKGQLLVEFDIPAIKEAGFLVATPIVVTNHEQFDIKVVADKNSVEPGDALLEVTAK